MGAIMQLAKRGFNRVKKDERLHPLNIAMGVGFAPLTYMDQREQGHGGAYSAAYAGLEAAGWIFAEPLMWGLTVGEMAKTAGELVAKDINEGREKRYELYSHVKNVDGMQLGNLGGRVIQSAESATLRQRQESIMRQHKIAMETIMGSEARQLHR
jgi:hypothetical protein